MSRSFDAGGGTASVSKTEEADFTMPPSQDLAIFDMSYAAASLLVTEAESSLLDAESCLERSVPPKNPFRALPLLPALDGEATDIE